MQKEKKTTDIIISNLTDLLNKGNAHVSLDDALDGIPFDLLGKKVADLPYSIWQLAVHIRITQWDIWNFRVMQHMHHPNGLKAIGHLK